MSPAAEAEGAGTEADAEIDKEEEEEEEEDAVRAARRGSLGRSVSIRNALADDEPAVATVVKAAAAIEPPEMLAAEAIAPMTPTAGTVPSAAAATVEAAPPSAAASSMVEEETTAPAAAAPSPAVKGSRDGSPSPSSPSITTDSTQRILAHWEVSKDVKGAPLRSRKKLSAAGVEEKRMSAM
jgi:hypothetical protein